MNINKLKILAFGLLVLTSAVLAYHFINSEKKTTLASKITEQGVNINSTKKEEETIKEKKDKKRRVKLSQEQKQIKENGYQKLCNTAFEHKGKITIVVVVALAMASVGYCSWFIARSNGKALLKAAREGSNNKVEKLLKSWLINLNYHNKDGETVLIIASREGHEWIVGMFIAAGADINFQDKYGWTALTYTSKQDHKEIVGMLIEAGADIDLESQNFEDILIWACENNSEKVVQALVKADVDIDCLDKNGWTALIWASLRGHKEIVQLLIKAGAKLNIQGRDGITALIGASDQGYEDIVQIQRYRRFQQELRRLIANRKSLRSGIIYRRLLLFKLVPGIHKEWHRLHVKRPYIREQFEDRVRFFYIMKYKYKVSKKRLQSSLYNRFNSPYTLYRAYHLLYFRLDNVLYKMSFIPTFTYLRDNWSTQFWNISINCISNVSFVQRSLMVGDMFYIKSGLHICAIDYKLSFHYDNNFYLVYLLWLRLHGRDGLPISMALPTKRLHLYIGKIYIWFWYRFYKGNASYLHNYSMRSLYLILRPYMEVKLLFYGFWAHNYLMYKQFKVYMLISSIDHYVRWFSRSMCGFVYREPLGFLNGLHYSSFYNKESGSYGGHLRFTSTYK